MQKKYLLIVLLMVLVSFIFVGCADNGPKDDVTPTNSPTAIPQSTEDNDYTIEITGIGDKAIKITKGQIKEIAQEGKEVVFTEDNPVYASDKTDDDGNKIPHTLRGVYLEDVLATYADGAKITDFNGMSIYAADGYETILSEDIFNTEKGGVKMIIVYEYDGAVLNANEKSGALRVVFPDKPANTWAKQLSKITFSKSEETVAIPVTSNVFITESFGEKYDGSYELDDVTYFGISFKKLFKDGILKVNESEQMLVYAWDGSEYTSSKTYEYYNDAYLVYASKEKGLDEFVADSNAPVFNGVNIKKGMKVKNTMYATVGDSTVLTLKVAFVKLDTDKNNEILLSDLFKEIHMRDSATYTITAIDGTTSDITSNEVKDAKVVSNDEGYTVNFGDKEILVSNMKVK